MLDLRVPSGLFFTATGLILIVMGFVSPVATGLLTQSNVNLYSGIVMFLFGAGLLMLSRLKR